MSNKISDIKVSRRRFLVGGAAGFAALGVAGLPVRRAHGATSIVVADPGGPFKKAFSTAFYHPFEQTTGNEIDNVARSHQPSAKITAIVETGNYKWDVVTVTQGGQVLLGEDHDYLEPLDWSIGDMGDIMPEARTGDWMGTDVYCTVLSYRTDSFGNKAPQNWADFWDIKGFPGRRSLRKSPIDTLEIALMADGVDPKSLYPIDFDRAFNKLDEIRPHIDVWWSGGAQTSQMLATGEVDMLPTWNARAQTVIDAGKPVGIVWNQGLYSIEGWAIPKGNPKADLGRTFIGFCADPKRQAAYTQYLAYGPTNLRAYDYIAEERADVLPTSPKHFDLLTLADQRWWGDHKKEAESKFNEWLLLG